MPSELTRYRAANGGQGGSPVRRRIATVALCIAATVLMPWFVPAACTARPVADSTDALQAELDALQPGGYLKLSSQVYEHRGVIKLRVPDVRIDGDGATLRATNDETSAVQIEADGVSLSNVNLAASTDGRRWSGVDQHKLVVFGQGANVSGISITGSAASGIFVDGARDFKINDVSVTGSRADGIHVTGGSSGGVIQNVRTGQTGDDGVAVVSYESDGRPSDNIQMRQIEVSSTRWGRGISVVGGRNVRIEGFSVADTNAAGVYIATEGSPYFTDSVDSVTVSGGTVTNANTNPDIVQGAVLIVAGNASKSLQNVQVDDVSIAATPKSAGRNVGVLLTAGTVSSVSLNDIRISDAAVPPIYSNARSGSYTTSGWTVGGNPVNVT